jgi:hypothetical protein
VYTGLDAARGSGSWLERAIGGGTLRGGAGESFAEIAVGRMVEGGTGVAVGSRAGSVVAGSRAGNVAAGRGDVQLL